MNMKIEQHLNISGKVLSQICLVITYVYMFSCILDLNVNNGNGVFILNVDLTILQEI